MASSNIRVETANKKQEDVAKRRDERERERKWEKEKESLKR